MKCVLLGATQGYGLETLLKLNEKGHICYVMCRTPSAFQETLKERNIDINMTREKKKLINPVKGDTFKSHDVLTLFYDTGEDDIDIDIDIDIDLVLISLDGRPSFKNPFAPKLLQPEICTRTILTVFTTLFPTASKQPRLIVISSNGLGAQGYADLPWLLKPVYGWLLREPNTDKEKMERQINTWAGIQHVDFNPNGEDKGKLGNVIIVRPALLTNGGGRGTQAGNRLLGAWTISRDDVAEFIVSECIQEDSCWKGRGVTVASRGINSDTYISWGSVQRYLG